MNRLLKKDVLKFLSKAKQEGKIKYVGFSYHGTTEEFPLLLDAYDWDMVMIQYNYFDNNVQADIEGIHHAASKGMGIFIMEPLKGGILAGKMPDEVESIFEKLVGEYEMPVILGCTELPMEHILDFKSS